MLDRQSTPQKEVLCGQMKASHTGFLAKSIGKSNSEKRLMFLIFRYIGLKEDRTIHQFHEVK